MWCARLPRETDRSGCDPLTRTVYEASPGARRDDHRAHLLGRAPIEAWNASSVETQVLDTYEAERTVSHFADVTVDPDGNSVFAWTDPDEGLLVAHEEKQTVTNGTSMDEGDR